MNRFIINKLVLVGNSKNYEVLFSEGLNIVFGDFATGKSSILDLINYCLGASSIELYPEIESKVKYCLLELDIDLKIYTIKRDIFHTENYIEVFNHSIESYLKDNNSEFPKLLSPNYKSEAPSGFFSDFMLERLNIPKVKIKTSPSKDNSDLQKLSFRDLFHYCYLSQDDIGSKNLLSVQNYSYYPKIKQIFKFINKILDSQITEIENAISIEDKKKNAYQAKMKAINDFLNETQIRSYLDLSLESESLNNNLNEITEKLGNLNKDIINSSAELNGIRNEYNSEEANYKDIIGKIENENNDYLEYSKLSKEYSYEINKLNATIKISNPLQQQNTHNLMCPFCSKEMTLKDINEKYEISDSSYLENELKRINQKHKNIKEVIENKHSQIKQLYADKQTSQNRMFEMSKILDDKTEMFIAPFTKVRDAYITQKEKIQIKLEEIKKEQKIRMQVEDICNEIKCIEERISSLKIELQNLRDNAPSDLDIRADLGFLVKQILEQIGLKNVSDVKISETNFLPMFRGKDYSLNSSGGVRTTLSFAYFLSILERSIVHDLYKPKILLLDTIGKYIGKTKDKYLDETDSIEDEKESIQNDPEKYKNMFKELLRVSNKAKEKNVPIQIIVVDNDFPGDEYAEFFRKKFSSIKKQGFDIGLIDDFAE